MSRVQHPSHTQMHRLAATVSCLSSASAVQVALDAEGLPKYISLDWDSPQEDSAPQESEEQAQTQAASAGQVQPFCQLGLPEIQSIVINTDIGHAHT